MEGTYKPLYNINWWQSKIFVCVMDIQDWPLLTLRDGDSQPKQHNILSGAYPPEVLGGYALATTVPTASLSFWMTRPLAPGAVLMKLLWERYGWCNASNMDVCD